MLTSTNRFQRRKLIRMLQAEDISRKELLSALKGVKGLEPWINSEAKRVGHPTKNLESALALNGTHWARVAVKRFFLSPTPP